jgi:hypothetical protein
MLRSVPSASACFSAMSFAVALASVIVATAVASSRMLPSLALSTCARQRTSSTSTHVKHADALRQQGPALRGQAVHAGAVAMAS